MFRRLYIPLLFMINHFQNRLSDGFQGVAVDVLHRVVHGVPERAERVRGMSGIVVDDVDTRDAAQSVYVDVVVHHFGSVLLYEVGSITQLLGFLPNLLHFRTGCAGRIGFIMEGGTLTAYHVEQDTVASVVAVDVRGAGPVLRTQAPGVGLVRTFVEFGDTVVFGVEEHDVDAQLRLLLLQLTGNLEQDTHTAGTVVHTQDGGVVVFRVGVGICIRSAVPMGTEQDAFLVFRSVGTDDVAGLQNRAVVGNEVGILVIDLSSEAFQLLGQVIAAGTVGCRVGYTRSEVGLVLYILIGTVGIEGRHLDDFLRSVVRGIALAGAAATRNGGEQEK